MSPGPSGREVGWQNAHPEIEGFRVQDFWFRV